MRQELPQELSESHRAEGGLLQRNQLSVAGIYRSEQRHRLSRGSMHQQRVRILGRNPHHRSRSVLLEVAFIQAPDFIHRVFCQLSKFF